MKRVFLMIITVSVLPFYAMADTWVNGYQRQDGTYVQGHYKSDRDNNPYNNYSTTGNVNPYTGKQGHKNPYSSYGN